VRRARVSLWDRGQRGPVGWRTVLCDVASTAAERAAGLGGRAWLEDGEGMLFDLRDTARATTYFTMRGMVFPLDFAVIRAGEVYATYGAQPGAGQVFATSAADFVLEVPRGWLEASGVGRGSRVIVAPA
jgi:uncharacterized membrane protein (UPF0127 family)